MLKSIEKKLDNLVGDVPVSEQISVALSYKEKHIHEEYVTRDEFEALKTQVYRLIDLVGDKSVVEQISEALKNIR